MKYSLPINKFLCSLVQPDHVTLERSSVPTSTPCHSVESTTTGNHTLEVRSHPETHRSVGSSGSRILPQDPVTLYIPACFVYPTNTNPEKGLMVRKFFRFHNTEMSMCVFGSVCTRITPGALVYKFTKCEHAAHHTLTRTNVTSIFDFSPTRFRLLVKAAAENPKARLFFLFTRKWPEPNKQRKTAGDWEPFPKHSERKFTVDSIISLSRYPVITIIITNCLALQTHFGGELHL